MDLSESGRETRRHPWEVARARFFVDTVAPLRPARVLDVGAGDAYLVKRLLERAPEARAVAWDTSYSEDDLRTLSSERLAATRAQPTALFDVALVLDLLEHVADDAALLRTVCQLVQPGGAVVVSVPAWPSLHGAHDMQLRHLRRYPPKQARALLEAAGLHIEASGGLFHALLVPRALEVSVLQRVGRARIGGSAGVGAGGWSAGPIATAAVSAALRVDNLVSRALATLHLSAPGLSWWALARR